MKLTTGVVVLQIIASYVFFHPLRDWKYHKMFKENNYEFGDPLVDSDYKRYSFWWSIVAVCLMNGLPVYFFFLLAEKIGSLL